MAIPLYESMHNKYGAGTTSVAVENGRHFAPGGAYEGKMIDILPYAADLVVSMTASSIGEPAVPMHIPDLAAVELAVKMKGGHFSGDGSLGRQIVDRYIEERIEGYEPGSLQYALSVLLSIKGMKAAIKLGTKLLKGGGNGSEQINTLNWLAKERVTNQIHRRVRGAGNYLISLIDQKEDPSTLEKSWAYF